MAHILVIDDDLSILSLFEQFLTNDGHSVAVASNGRNGLRMMEKQKPDLIITDIMMPEMDGLELLMELRKDHSDIPIIAISGGMQIQPVSFLPQAKKFGADRIFIKPVSLVELRQAIRELLTESQSGEQA
jgi:CheY-like chemotaxis protein